MENKKSTGKTALIVLLLIVTIASLVLATYAWAKYTTTENGTATAQVAKWNVTANTAALTFEKEFTHVVKDQMAPGTNGSFSASLDVTGTEVDVDYTITITEITNKPTNLILKDSDGNELAVNSTITGTITTADTTKTAQEVITWEWPYETAGNVTVNGVEMTGDEADTADGIAEADMTIKYTITAVQVQPQ